MSISQRDLKQLVDSGTVTVRGRSVVRQLLMKVRSAASRIVHLLSNIIGRSTAYGSWMGRY